MITSHGHILIVDDEKDIRESLKRHFEFLDYEVSTALNGKEALNVLSETRIDVIITDILMPEMNGIELLGHVKYDYPMIHVIVITGYVTLSNLLDCFRRGADTCVFKPLTELNELEEAVEHAFSELNNWQLKLRELKTLSTHKERA